MNFTHQLTWISNSISFNSVKKDNKQNLHLNDSDVLCSVPLNILAPKLTLKAAKKLANLHDMYMPSKILFGGVGHCFTWHVQVSLCFYFNFKAEELVHSGLCAMWHLGLNSIFPAARMKILPWKINRLLLYLLLLEITKVRIRFENSLFKVGKIISCIQDLIVTIVLSGQQKYFPYLDYSMITESQWFWQEII